MVVDEGVDLDEEAVVVDDDVALTDHLDADAREGAAFGEMQTGKVGFEELHFHRIARPEGQSEGDGVAVLVFHRENLAVGAVPELVFVHGIDKVEEWEEG